MTIDLNLTPELQSELERQAAALGEDSASFVSNLVRDSLELQCVAAATIPGNWTVQLQEWVDSFPPVGHVVDDSRERIFE